MGAGLAAQRGWPQGQGQDLPSPLSTDATTSVTEEDDSAGRQHQGAEHHADGGGVGGVGNDLLLFEEVARTEVQPLEDGEYARNYGSAASLTNLVPLDRKRQSSLVDDENGGESSAAPRLGSEWGSVAGESELLGAGGQRDGREQSVAYDLGAVLSTEEEVRVRVCACVLFVGCFVYTCFVTAVDTAVSVPRDT